MICAVIYCSFCCIYVWLDPGTYMIARFMFFYKPGVTFGTQLDGTTSLPLRSMVLGSSPSNFVTVFGRWKMGFVFDFSGRNICFLGKLLLATSISTNAGQFLLSKLATVLFVMNFGGRFRVKSSMANLHLGAMTFTIQLFVWCTSG